MAVICQRRYAMAWRLRWRLQRVSVFLFIKKYETGFAFAFPYAAEVPHDCRSQALSSAQELRRAVAGRDASRMGSPSQWEAVRGAQGDGLSRSSDTGGVIKDRCPCSRL